LPLRTQPTGGPSQNAASCTGHARRFQAAPDPSAHLPSHHSSGPQSKSRSRHMLPRLLVSSFLDAAPSVLLLERCLHPHPHARDGTTTVGVLSLALSPAPANSATSLHHTRPLPPPRSIASFILRSRRRSSLPLPSPQIQLAQSRFLSLLLRFSWHNLGGGGPGLR
jgi:hypothetical protein